MLKKYLHKIVALPQVYDIVQNLLGANYIRKKICVDVGNVKSGIIVVDVGGGTGNSRTIFPADCTYICLDNDPVKLKGFSSKLPDDLPLLASAVEAPIATDSIDMVICVAVSHHLHDEILDKFFSELLRILKPEGRLIFLDAVWMQYHPSSRLLWHYDRGAFPRSADLLQKKLTEKGKILSWKQFTLFHRYILAVVIPRTT